MVVVFQSAVRKGNFSFQPPTGHTGATGDYCTNCHADFGLNSGGGTVSVTGLPLAAYVPNQVYNFSLTISHGVANRQRWGFSISAINTGNNASLGTFSTTNANAATNTNELSHFSAVTTGSQSSYTYNNLRWQAPATAGLPVRFYFVGNAGNNAGGSSGDYIYSSSLTVLLPVELSDFKAQVNGSQVVLNWKTLSETNSSHFEIEKSDNGQDFYYVGTVNAKGAGVYNFIDKKPSYYERSIFYRLKVVDKDGSFKYSKTIDARLKANAVFVKKAFPTSFKPGTTVNAEIVSDRNQTVSIELFDISGKRYLQTTKAVVQGNTMIDFVAPATVSSGILFARFSGSGWQQTISLSVQ